MFVRTKSNPTLSVDKERCKQITRLPSVLQHIFIQWVRFWTLKTESPAATAQEGASGRGAPSEAALFGVYGSVGDFGKHTHRECAVMESLVTKQKRVKHIYR